jgi:hypothetical protein
MLERNGNVRAGPVKDGRQTTLEPVILTNVVRGSTISSDENRAYYDLRNSGYKHGAVNHSAEEWVRGSYHVNSLEGYWSQFKRSVRGTNIHISQKHMWKYVSEFSYRYNMRKRPTEMFSRLISGLSLPRLKAG